MSASYTIHLPPAGPAEDTVPDRFRVVKDGLRPLAILFGPLYLLARRLWLWSLIAMLAVGAIIAASVWLGIPGPIARLMQVALHFLIALEASTLERAKLAGRGWREIGDVFAGGSAEAEMRAASLVATQAGMDDAPPQAGSGAAAFAPRTLARTPGPSPVLGLFPDGRP